MRRAITWQLVLGLAIVVGWLVLGLAAPLLTSVDPLKTKSFVIIGTRTIPPPFEPGLLPGVGRSSLRLSSKARTCIVFPSPISSAKHPPNPNLRRNAIQPRPSRW